MLKQMLLGSFLIGLTVFVQVAFIEIAIFGVRRIALWLARGQHIFRMSIALSIVTVWMATALGASMSVWALALWGLGIFDGYEPAIYFSSVAFTTLGFGDVILPFEWRLLSGFIAANGLILFSLGTAFLIEVLRQLHPSLPHPNNQEPVETFRRT